MIFLFFFIAVIYSKKKRARNPNKMCPPFNKAVYLFWHNCRDEADVRHVDGAVLKINYYINYCGNEIRGAVPISLVDLP